MTAEVGRGYREAHTAIDTSAAQFLNVVVNVN